MKALIATAQALIAPSKGLLAMDESTGTCNRRLAEFGITQTEESRRRYRELRVTAPGLSESISGAILFDETFHQNNGDGVPFTDVLRSAGSLVGIKVDAGARALAGHPGELVNQGLDGLRERLDGPTLAPRSLPWPITFSFGRALQQQALRLWAGNDENCVAAQRALLHRARCNAAAAQGAWRLAMETEGLPA